jgi:mycothiol synthase
MVCGLAGAESAVDSASSVARGRYSDAHGWAPVRTPPGARLMRIVADGLRCVAEEGGRVLGRADAAHNPWMFHPRKYELRLEVDAGQRRRGVGAALLARVVDELRARDALALRAVATEDDAEAVGFLTRRGFREVWREIPSELDLAGFDGAPFADRAAPAGLAITTLAEEVARDRGVLRELYELHTLCNLGQQELDPITPHPFAEFVAGQVEGPQAMPEAWFLARDPLRGPKGGGVLVGMSSLERLPDGLDTLEAGYTAVHPDHRRRGIALALKLRAIEHARAHGYRAIKTHNNAINTGMRAINTALGFRPGPAMVTFELRLH